MLKQKYFLTDFFILSAEKQPIKLSWRNIEWLPSFEVILRNQLHYALARHFSDGNWIINQKSGFMVASSLTYTNKRTKKKVTNDYILKDFVQNVGDPPAEENFNFINL